MEEVFIETPHELASFTESIRELLLRDMKHKKGATVLALHGELGTGKTTFVQALSRAFGITSYVPSPTFVVMRSYPLTGDFKKFVHIDAYRIAEKEEIEVIKIPELFRDSHTIVCIEWAEKVEYVIPRDAYHITFSHARIYGDGDMRKVEHGYRESDT